MTDKIIDWMYPNPLYLHPEEPLKRALHILLENNLTEIAVVENQKWKGIIKLQDVVQKDNDEKVSSFIRSCDRVASADLLIDKLQDIPTYIVNDEGELIGEITGKEWLHYHTTITKELKQKEEMLHLYEMVFDTAYEGLTVVDDKGIIRLFNEAYSRYVKVPTEEAIGKDAALIIENTRLPVVLKTGVPERSQAHRLQGQNLVVHRIPIWKDNKVVAAAGILVYEGVSEIYQVIDQMEELDKTKHSKFTKDPNKKNSLTRFEDLLGDSPCFTKTKKIARKASQSKAPVLITGESGVGKDIVAQAIHNESPITRGRFISVNCAAIPEALLESELFGYSSGAFTGAEKGGKPGKIELAHKGTLFLDEIGDMPLTMQAKILRVIQEKSVERVGSNHQSNIDFRLITATNKDIKQMVHEGTFREDLYYRLYVIPIHIPSLRERAEDIPIIVSHKIAELNNEYGDRKTIDQLVVQWMYTQPWKGNIRELINFLERLYVLSESQHMTLDNLPDDIDDKQRLSSYNFLANKKVAESLSEEEERDRIKETLEHVKGNKTKAAKLLGISRATLYNKLSRYTLE
ncbi:transcriptional regulator [Oceanobacillus iheyensis HTE831]|uniref:Transcriptional regulator n=1 Tax=Oceanobacillus iheyensis (strain DSM 14371 / CIP 107618 / JCM 11309 / KCTC 3954 / HTE831) TaxID=221109 RepID=Q8ES30_OCEIH|nr:sigma-54-dependent Fis family transcriptional regulator [Oceanobacillus iheyensis]BAC12769.1 transcriptional regulator [Oceanobacillus iheyensis HTE831]